MKVAFHIARMVCLGHLGPVIDYFQKKGAEIVLLCDHRRKPKEHGYKAYLYPDLEKIKSVFSEVEIRPYRSTKEFAEIIQENQMQVVFFLAIDSIAKEAKALSSEHPEWGNEKMRGIAWEVETSVAVLQAGADILVLRHPLAVEETKKYITKFMKK